MSALAVLDRVLYGEWEGRSGGDKLTQLMNVLSIATSLLLLVAGRQTFGVVRRVPVLPLAIIGLFFVSAGWSMDPAGTIRRAVNYAVMVAGALGMAYAMSPLRIMRITVQVCTIAAVSSLLLRATPYGVLVHSGDDTDFRGVFGFKNMLGEAMVAGVLGALHCYMAEPRRRLKYALRIVLYLLVTVASNSATSLLISLSSIELLAVMALYTRGGAMRVLSLAALGLTLLVLGVIAVDPNLLFGALGKDPTLTGRTDIWAYVMQPIAEKPFFGWGFNGFWMNNNPAALAISNAVRWTVPEAHNGLLECLLQLGVFGTGLVLMTLIHALRVGMRCIRHGDVHLGRTMIIFLFGLLIMSVSEAILLTPSQIPTLQLFLYAFMCDVSLAVATRKATQRVRAPAGAALSLPRLRAFN